MTYAFGTISAFNLSTCDSSLRHIADEVMGLQVMDFSVVCGHRTEAAQHRAFVTGKSKVQYPNSKHNKMPSRAMDLAPYPIDWDNSDDFYLLAGLVLAVAAKKGVELRWGGNFNGDNKRGDFDPGHFELVS